MSYFRRTPEEQAELDALIAQDLAMVEEEERRIAEMPPNDKEVYLRAKKERELLLQQTFSVSGGDFTRFSAVERVLRYWPEPEENLTQAQLAALGSRENTRLALIALLPLELQDQYR